MFDAASRIKAKSTQDFGSSEQLREYLLTELREVLDREQQGVIADVGTRPSSSGNRFVRVGKGSIGGKGRSIAFINSLIVRHNLLARFDGLEIRIPKTVVIGADEFDQFMDQYSTADLLGMDDDQQIRQLSGGSLRTGLRQNLQPVFAALHGPLAVRSSSLLEDSRLRPFAGVYSTYMLPNNHPDPEVRFAQLCSAIKAVYASIFSKTARTYIAGTPHAVDEEKMAIVIQQVVGRTFGTRFYPHLSGVAQSHNYYPIGHQKSAEGVAVVALGMGETVVGGGAALRFSPGSPAVLPQFATAKDYLRHTQKQFYAINLAEPTVDILKGAKASLSLHDLDVAEADGTLALVGSVYSAEDDMIRDNLKQAGPRVLTFNNLLKWNVVPLVDALADLLKLLRHAMGGEIEIEFALDMADWGKTTRGKKRTPRLYVLQLRPKVRQERAALDLDFESLEASAVLCKTRRSLGHGIVGEIRDVVYVKRDDVDFKVTPKIAAEVAKINEALQADHRPYLLVGPGRWGTSDHSLGIPVQWSQIAGVRVIIEVPLGKGHADPSQGTHFFHNLVAQRVGYLTATPEVDGCFDRAWLDALPAQAQTEWVRHVRLEQPLDVQMDGLRGWAAILKPGANLKQDAQD